MAQQENHDQQPFDPDAPPPLSKSSRFNLKVMWNINRLSITVFVLAVLYKVIDMLTR